MIYLTTTFFIRVSRRPIVLLTHVMIGLNQTEVGPYLLYYITLSSNSDWAAGFRY